MARRARRHMGTLTPIRSCRGLCREIDRMLMSGPWPSKTVWDVALQRSTLLQGALLEGTLQHGTLQEGTLHDGTPQEGTSSLREDRDGFIWFRIGLTRLHIGFTLASRGSHGFTLASRGCTVLGSTRTMMN